MDVVDIVRVFVLAVCLVAPSFGAETWEFDEATSTVTASDGLDVDGSRCDFDGFYEADRAGTRTLLSLTASTTTDVAALDQSILACERGEVRIVIANTPKAGATADLTGTDGYGDALSLSGIDISSGLTTASRKFGSVSSIALAGVDIGSTLSVYQDQWGVVHKVASGSWAINPGHRVAFGDGGVGYFESLNESVYFCDTASFGVIDNFQWRLGEASGDYGINGSWWSVGAGATLDVIGETQPGAEAALYASTLHNRSDALLRFMDGSVTARNTTFSGPGTTASLASAIVLGDTTDMDRVTFSQMKTVTLSAAAGTFTNILSQGLATGITFDGISDTVDGLGISGSTTDVEMTGATTGTLLDSTTAMSAATVAAGGVVDEVFSFDFYLQDSDGSAVEGATIALTDALGNTEFSVATGASGSIATQAVTYRQWLESSTATFSPYTVTITESDGTVSTLSGVAVAGPTAVLFGLAAEEGGSSHYVILDGVWVKGGGPILDGIRSNRRLILDGVWTGGGGPVLDGARSGRAILDGVQ